MIKYEVEGDGIEELWGLGKESPSYILISKNNHNELKERCRELSYLIKNANIKILYDYMQFDFQEYNESGSKIRSELKWSIAIHPNGDCFLEGETRYNGKAFVKIGNARKDYFKEESA